ncbi:MAG: hypothetical protein IKN77_09405 [Paludibacteraceae bacterium]|nr:hypothetical protein [Paludibacteraceae bacterium]
MKRRFFILSVIGLLSLGFAACGSDDEEEGNGNNQNNVVQNGEDPFFSTSYLGKMQVGAGESSFVNDSAVCAYSVEEKALVLVNAKLMTGMPTLDTIRVDGVSFTEKSVADVTFAGENIVPTWKGRPFEQYTLTSLQGYAKNDSLVFSCMMGQFPVEFAGKLILVDIMTR